MKSSAIWAAAILLSVSGCMSMGTNFDPAAVAQLQPGMTRDEVIRRLRAGSRQPGLPVVVLTGTIDERLTPASLGADALLTKPANLARLITEVKRLLAEAEQ